MFRRILIGALLLSAVLASDAFMPGAAFCGGGSGVGAGFATESTQWLNYGLLGEQAEWLEKQYGKDLEKIANQIKQIDEAVKIYEQSILMASRLTVLDVLGFTNFTNRLRKIVASVIGLYDTLEGLDDVLEKAYEGHKTNFLDLGFDDIRDFAKSRKQRYMSDVYNEMKRGAAALEHLDDVKTDYEKKQATIDEISTYVDGLRAMSRIAADTNLQIGQLYAGLEMLATARAQTEAARLEIEMQEDMIIEKIIRNRQDVFFEYKDVTGDSWEMDM